MKRSSSLAGATSVRTSFVFSRILLLLFLAAIGFSTAALAATQSADALYKQGKTAEAREDYDLAYQSYQQAYAKAPKELRYREAIYRVRTPASAAHLMKGRKLAAAGDENNALLEYLRAADIDPTNDAPRQEIARLRARQGQPDGSQAQELPEILAAHEDMGAMAAPVDLKPISNEPLTLHMSEDSKVVYQAIGRAAGVNIIFDPDYNSKRIQIDLNGVNLTDALRIAGTLSNTFWRPVTTNTIFVAQNTRAKRTELDQQAVQTFYLTNAWQQNDLNDVQTALRNVLPNAKVYGVASQNAIVMRGTPDELLLAEKLINDLDKARPEVVVDIAVLEVSKNWEKNFGLTWPSSASVNLQSATTSTSSSSSSTTTTSSLCSTSGNCSLSTLSHLNSSNFGVTVGAATANLLLTDSNTKILQNPRIRATDQQKAVMKIGERIPIATGSYSTGTATTSTSSLVNTQFQYVDIGVNIEVTPTIHYNRDVTLKVKIEVTSQNGSTTISGVTEPIIGQKTSEQTVRLKEGEANILGGIFNQQDQVAWTGIPGLSSIPLLKYLFGSKDHTIQDNQIVFMMVPHVVRSQTIESVNLRSIDTGVGQSIELRRAPAAAQPAKPAQPAAPKPQASVGVYPNQSAQAAIPAALAEMRQAMEPKPTPAANSAPPAAPVALTLGAPTAPVATGAAFQIPITLTGGVDIAAAPMQVRYDPEKISLVNVTAGDLLARDGQAVAMVHRDDGPGLITLNSARPPGSGGVTGSGVVCVLSFQAKASGPNQIEIVRPAALTSAQKQVVVLGSKLTVEVK